MSHAWAIAEIRDAILANLDAPSLYAAPRVCRMWHGTSVDLLWRSATAKALQCIKPERRKVYEGAIRRLDLTQATAVRRLINGWNFAHIFWLLIHPNVSRNPTAFAELLARCGPTLEIVQLAMPPNSPVSGVTGQHDVRQYSVHADVLQLLAERVGLSVLEAGAATIPGSALASVRAAVAAPFPAMSGCCVCIAAADGPALMALLTSPPTGRLLSLSLAVDIIGTTPATRRAVCDAIFARAPGLRSQRIFYNPMRLPHAHYQLPPPPPGSSVPFAISPADDGVPDNFSMLRGLHELEALTLQGTLFVVHSAAWRALLDGLPRLQRLTVGRLCAVPRDALVTAGEACRQLSAVELRSNLDFGGAVAEEAAVVARRHPPGWVLFPELRSVRVMPPVEGEAEYVCPL